ncbi:MAG: sucrose phosphorylase, partial [Alteromonadales bacterium]
MCARDTQEKYEQAHAEFWRVIMSIRNGVQLITYADRLGDGNIESLTSILQGPLGGLFTGVHILPFYYPYDGEDAGFDPIDHTLVDERLGDWENVK